MNKILYGIINDISDNEFLRFVLNIVGAFCISLPVWVLLTIFDTIMGNFLPTLSLSYIQVNFCSSINFKFLVYYLPSLIIAYRLNNTTKDNKYAINTDLIKYLSDSANTAQPALTQTNLQCCHLKDIDANKSEIYESLLYHLDLYFILLPTEDYSPFKTHYLVIPRCDTKLFNDKITPKWVEANNHNGHIEMTYEGDIKYFQLELNLDNLNRYNPHSPNTEKYNKYYEDLSDILKTLIFVTEINGIPINISSLSSDIKNLYVKAGEQHE